ncbi:MAG: hypothetical protein HC822_23260 [Oscillochloris sp.]|nr:hypothetical protein [Oscillochloris sp.]
MTLWPYLLGFTVLALPIFLRIEGRAAAPIVPLNLFASRQLGLTYTLCVCAGSAWAA